jgi:hypothetical protein
MPPCRGRRHQSAFTKKTCHSFTLQILLASHQLFMMTMASHHRHRPQRHHTTAVSQRLRTASAPRNGITPSSPLATASHRRLLVAASHHRLLHAASHRNWLPATSHRKRPPSRIDSLHLAWSPPSHRLGPSGSDTNCWSCNLAAPSSSSSDLSHNLLYFLKNTHTNATKEEETIFAVTSPLAPKTATFSSLFH